MRITKHWHSCLLIEQDETKILVDPGNYCFLPGRAKPEDFKNLTAILLTHEHGDHADPEAIRKILRNNPVPVYGNNGVKKKLGPFGIETIFLEDHVIKIGNMRVEAISAEHEPLIEEAPENNAYILDGAFLITGDSYDRQLANLKVRALALPVLSPFAGMHTAYEFLRRIEPKFMIPMHDGFVFPEFLEGQYKRWEKTCRELGIDFRPMKDPREALEV